MDIQRKDATITNTVDAFPGEFEVILSAPTKDRDGDTLLPGEWKQPLPDRITFDADHGMSVATTVGSGVPRIDDATGNLIVAGTYSSLARAQEVRTLVNEGHIRTTSVAFMTEKSTAKDGATTSVRELLNGAFVAIPSNREALVMSSKTAVKTGARNSASDASMIQSMHDTTTDLGATCGTKAARKVDVKSIVGSLEATQDRAADALEDTYPNQMTVLRGTLPDVLIFDVIDPMTGESQTYRQTYTDDGAVITLTGAAEPVDVAEIVTPDADEAEDPNATGPSTLALAATVHGTLADESDISVRVHALAIIAAAYND